VNEKQVRQLEQYSSEEANFFSSEIARLLKESAQIKLAIATSGVKAIENMVELIISTYRNGGKVVICGNGGSAADAQHIATEFIGRFELERKALPAISLTTNSSLITALANDYGYITIFRRQVEALVNKNDVVIGISTSGKSPNIIEALKAARIKGAKTIGLTGGDGGKLSKVSDCLIVIPSNSTPRIQESHITIGHIVCGLVEKQLVKEGLI